MKNFEKDSTSVTYCISLQTESINNKSYKAYEYIEFNELKFKGIIDG